jgi:hypothetical protein
LDGGPPSQALTPAELAEEERRREQRQVIQELAAETAKGRTHVAAAKEAQHAAALSQREALKAAFLAKLKAGKAGKAAAAEAPAPAS